MKPHNATIERKQRVWLSVQVWHQHAEKSLQFKKEKKKVLRGQRDL